MVTHSQPNILILMDDQHRWDAFGYTSNHQIRTPHLDGLAQESVTFQQAVTPTPVCIAARMSLITGHRAATTHWVDNAPLPGPIPELPTFMTLLHRSGYWTQAIGKMHFSGRHYGLAKQLEMAEVVRSRIDDDYLCYLRELGIRTRFPQGIRDLLYFQPQTSGIPEEHSKSRWVANRSVEFLRNHVRYRGGQPFLLWSSFTAPHPPFAPSEPYDTMYASADMPLPTYTGRSITSLPPALWRHRARLDGAHHDPDRMRRIRALYYGLISQVDDCVGQILAELKRLRLAENTVVLFLSDHGEMMGDHGLSQKDAPYEPSIRIPLLLRWPGKTEAGKVCEDLVGLTDIMPTFLQELDLQYPDEHPAPLGSSLLGHTGGGLCQERDAYVVDYGQEKKRWIAIRTADYKYAYFYHGGLEELYNLSQDPAETHNLAYELPEITRHFRERAVTWEQTHGLGRMVENGKLKAYPMPREVPPEDACRLVLVNDGQWPKRLPEDEKSSVESFAAAFTRAIAKESSLSPEKLSIGQYKRKVLQRGPEDKGGESLVGTPWEQAWARAEEQVAPPGVEQES